MSVSGFHQLLFSNTGAMSISPSLAWSGSVEIAWRSSLKSWLFSYVTSVLNKNKLFILHCLHFAGRHTQVEHDQADQALQIYRYVCCLLKLRVIIIATHRVVSTRYLCIYIRELYMNSHINIIKLYHIWKLYHFIYERHELYTMHSLHTLIEEQVYDYHA